jgi:hypothetical protein
MIGGSATSERREGTKRRDRDERSDLAQAGVPVLLGGVEMGVDAGNVGACFSASPAVFR